MNEVQLMDVKMPLPMVRRRLPLILAALLFLTCGALLAEAPSAESEEPSGPSLEETTSSSPGAVLDYEGIDTKKIGDVLIMLFVLSVVFEVALTPIFNWRLFLLHWEGKGIKTPLTIVLAFLVFWRYDVDIFARILEAFNGAKSPGFWGKIVTAFLIAGGSDAIFRIFTKLKLHDPKKRKQKMLEARAALKKSAKKETTA